MAYVNAFFGWVWRKKVFFGIVLLSAILLFVVIFPFGDLSDAVTSQVAHNTSNQVYLQMDDLKLDVIPAPGVNAKGVNADLFTFPTLSIKDLVLRPAYLSLIFSPIKLVKAARGDLESAMYLATLALAHVRANGILGGNVDLDLAPEKADQGAVTTRADVEIESVDLSRAGDWAALPVKLKGKISADLGLRVNTAMQEQPEGEFSVKVANFELPAGPVMTQMGPINLPTVQMKNVLFRGRLTNGNLMLEEGTFGQAGEPAHGKMKGQIALRIVPGAGAQVGQYNLTVDLNLTSAFEKELGFAFLLENYKTPGAGGNRYLMRIQGTDMANPPLITRVSSF
jgi:type II secretion system protein N